MYIVSNTWNPPPQKKLISLMAVETKTVVTRAGRRQVRGKAYQWVVSYDWIPVRSSHVLLHGRVIIVISVLVCVFQKAKRGFHVFIVEKGSALEEKQKCFF